MRELKKLSYFFAKRRFRQFFLHDIIGLQRSLKANSVDKKGEKKMTYRVFRQIDELGRIVVPKELRVMFGIENGDEVRIEYDEKGILISLILQ